jgi:hypothetical protein
LVCCTKKNLAILVPTSTNVEFVDLKKVGEPNIHAERCLAAGSGKFKCIKRSSETKHNNYSRRNKVSMAKLHDPYI